MKKILSMVLGILCLAQAAVAKFDLVVALGGGDARKTAAVAAVKRGDSANILFTGDPDVAAEYVEFGVPGNVNGVVPPLISTDTPGDMRLIRKVLASRGWVSLEIFDSSYHCARSELLASRILGPFYSPKFVCPPQSVSFWVKLNEARLYAQEFLTIWR